MNLAYTLINLIGEEISSEASVLGVNLIQELINNLESAKSSLIEQKLILDSINEEVIDVREIGNSISSPVLELEKIIKDFENHENSSDIDDQIDDLKKIKDQISSNFSNFDEMNVKISGLKLNIDLLVINLDNLINSLNVFEINNAESIIAPFDFKLESINPVDEKREYLIPTIISLIALFGGILISSTLVLKNKKTRAYFRNFVTPTRDITFVFATYLTSLIILLMQFLLVFLGLYFVFDMNFFASSFSILAILVLGCSTFIFIGMFLGYVFKSEETIVFSSVLFASILMFFSNIILPLENISSNLFRIVSFNPLVLVENALKKIYLFGLDFGSILVELTVLGLFLVFFGVLTYFMRRMNKKGL
jgi:ABC-type multidrug transport system permease subunit